MSRWPYIAQPRWRDFLLILLLGLLFGCDSASPLEPAPERSVVAETPQGNAAAENQMLLADSDATIHIVQPGDWLSKIAQRYYGDWRRYTEIYTANRHLIDNPDLIYPGQRLVIPKSTISETAKG